MRRMIKSAKPRKQRLFRLTAPMHVRQNFVNAHISKDLANRLGIRRRSIEVRRGDTVKIMAGRSRGKSGKVTKVNLGNGRILIDGVTVKDSKNKDVLVQVPACNVYLTDLDVSDKFRKAELDSLKTKK